MMRPARMLLLIAFLATVGSAGAQASGAGEPARTAAIPAASLEAGETGPVVVAPATAEPGGIVRVFVRGQGQPERVELLPAPAGGADQQAPVTTAFALPIRLTPAVGASVYIVGLDSTLSPGSYLLRGRDVQERTVFLRPLVVAEREFRREEIALNAAMTSLRSEYDPRKVEETRILTNLVLSRDPEAIFHGGPLGWPLPPDTRRTSLFGDRRTFLYADGGRARSIHVGLDFAAPVGTPIGAAGAGAVRMARDRIVTGGTVVIEHLPGIYTLYYHLEDIGVEEGEVVAEGDIIGTVGATGLATGPHLHWEVRIAGVPVSPEDATERPFLPR